MVRTAFESYSLTWLISDNCIYYIVTEDLQVLRKMSFEPFPITASEAKEIWQEVLDEYYRAPYLQGSKELEMNMLLRSDFYKELQEAFPEEE